MMKDHSCGRKDLLMYMKMQNLVALQQGDDSGWAWPSQVNPERDGTLQEGKHSKMERDSTRRRASTAGYEDERGHLAGSV